MKLTKTQIKEKQEELVETILKLDALGKQKKSLVAILDDDFNENEAKYRNGIVTPKGILVRRPKWNFEAKPEPRSGRKRPREEMKMYPFFGTTAAPIE